MKQLNVFLAVCVLSAATPWIREAIEPAHATAHGFPGWPTQWEGIALRSVPLEDRERRFADGFPGRVAKFQAAQQHLVMRWIERPTRQLHPAADCYRGSGYKTKPASMRIDASSRRWSCFLASRGADSVRVCEQLLDEQGSSWPDVSAWYWAAFVGQSKGPWWAVTMIEPAVEMQ